MRGAARKPCRDQDAEASTEREAVPQIHLSPHVLRVSESDPNAYHTISEAAQAASEGDQIIVATGTYILGKKKERFPIYIPPQCQLIGSGADSCKIDGGEDREIADRPLNPYQSLILLGDEATISGFTICNSCGNGLSNEQGARVLITKNIIRDNGHHGVLIFGANGALIQNNQFFNNGTVNRKFGGPRPGIGWQGHQVYIEGRFGATNEVAIINNIMEKVFADAIANDMYDQPDGFKMRLQIVGNVISECGRNGMSITSSYGPSKTDVSVNIRNNRILKTIGNAIDVVGSYSIVNRAVHDAKLVVNVVQNEVNQCTCGILVVGAYEASINCKARYNIIGNSIEHATDFGIRVVGGYNLDGWTVENTVSEVLAADNSITDAGKTPLLVQGGKSDKGGVVNGNIVYAHLVGNEIIANGEKKKPGEGIVIEDGEKNNHVILLEGSTEPVVAEGT